MSDVTPGGVNGAFAGSRSSESVPLGISWHKIENKESVGSPDIENGLYWSVYPSGLIYHGTKANEGNIKNLEGADKRGKISGWSKSSRRRMRDYMIKHSALPGWSMWGVSFTIPGQPPSSCVSTLTYTDLKEFWRRFTEWIKNQGWGMIWRLELQERGMPHWHCLLIVPFNDHEWLDAKLRAKFAYYMDKCLKPPLYEYRKTITARDGTTVYCWSVVGRLCHTTVPSFSRSQWDGEEHQVDLSDKDKGGEGAWLRYLQDHASKHKQEQIGVDVGRHWGVVGRRVFVELKPLTIAPTSKKAYFRVRRWMRRLRSPVIQGKIRKLSGGQFLIGDRVVFGSIETHTRMMMYAAMLDRDGV